MSRALNLTATLDQVTALCARQQIPISAIEALPKGGTRVVLNNADDTAAIAKAFRGKVITGPVARISFMGHRL